MGCVLLWEAGVKTSTGALEEDTLLGVFWESLNLADPFMYESVLFPGNRPNQ